MTTKSELTPLIVLLVGSPGSGKSTASAEFSSEDFVRISQDDQGKKEHMALFHQSINSRKNIVVDRMNFDKKQRDRYLDVARKAGYETRIDIFHVPMQTCMERCRARKGHPTITTEQDIQEAVTFFFRKYERVSDSEADWVNRLGWKENATKCIWSDLDGTMAKVDHRLKHVRVENRRDANWPRFFDEMVHDTVNHWCSELVHMMSERYPIVYATGRPADYEEHTELWLGENGLRLPGSSLFMRQKKDHRRDDIVKEIILEFEVKTRYNVLFAVDDRKQVVDMLRKHNITVLQCANGDF